MRIDAHMHLWRLERGDYGWITEAVAPLMRDFGPEDALPLLEAGEIAGVVLVQAAPTVTETRFLLEHAAREAWVRGVVGWADMAARGAPDVIAELASDACLKGLRPMLQDIPDPAWMLRPELEPAFRALVELDLVFDALVKPPHLPHLRRLLEHHPGLRVVIDHGAKPEIAQSRLEPWASEMRAIAAESTAFCKLSGLLTEAGPEASADELRPWIDVLLEAFGPERLIWGSDWPVLTLAGDYAGWLALAEAWIAPLGEGAHRAVFGANATRVYRL